MKILSLLLLIALSGCASQARQARANVPEHAYRHVSSVGASPNTLLAVKLNKRNRVGPDTNVLMCELPGSNVVFTFYYMNEHLLGDDNVELGITGLAYTTDEDFESVAAGDQYDFTRDKYRIITNLSSGLLTRPSYQSSNEGLHVELGERDDRAGDEPFRTKPRYHVRLVNAKVDFERKGGAKSQPEFTKLTALAEYNMMSSSNQIGEDVRQELTFTRDNCVGNLGSLAKYNFFTN